MTITRKFRAGVLVLYMVVIFVGSAIPGNRLGSSKIFELDKLLHLAEYLVLSILLCWVFVRYPSDVVWRSFLLVAVIGGLFAISDEVHQLFVPKRSFSLLDFAADYAGLVIGMVVYHIYMSKIYPKLRNAL